MARILISFVSFSFVQVFFLAVTSSTGATAVPLVARQDRGIDTGTGGGGVQLNITDERGKTALLWTSIAIAVFTSLIQGLITTAVQISEDQGLWTFRFRIARYEHIWWTAVSSLLAISFALIVLSFLAGNNQDSLGVLALSTATTIGIVRYAVPAWRNRVYIEHRWRAWTGPSRTGIKRVYRELCGDAAQWERLSKLFPEKKVISGPSDDWGFDLFPPSGLWEDPTAILDKFQDQEDSALMSYAAPEGSNYPCVYDDGNMDVTHGGNISLLWGEHIGFRRRVSRAITAVPSSLLSSRPRTIDGYNGEGLCLAMGILGRNKGLKPAQLVFDLDDALKKERGLTRSQPKTTIPHALESVSSWYPRPNKVMRSYYGHAINDQYGGLPEPYLAAALELALILLDIDKKYLRVWLGQMMEQQDIGVNLWMSGRSGMGMGIGTPTAIGEEKSAQVGVSVTRPKATNLQLDTLYRSSYASMIVSINSLALPPGDGKKGRPPVRPDVTCFALLYLAEGAVRKDETTGKWVSSQKGAAKPDWWDHEWVKERLQLEQQSLKGDAWKDPAAWLLGLKDFPAELGYENHPSWPNVIYVPEGSV